MQNDPLYYHPEYSGGHAPPGYLHEHQGQYGLPEGPYSPLTEPPDPSWDPAEELAYLLQDAITDQTVPAFPAGEEVAAADAPAGSPLRALHDITTELPPLRKSPQSHRKTREQQRLHLVRTASYAITALVALTASAVSLFSTAVAYDPLRIIAIGHTENSSVTWWPALVFGPWLVASLSVLRAALHQRRAVHSWCVAVLFSLITMLLCIAQAPRDVIDITVAVLPSLASLACFQQLVRQVTLTRPPKRVAPRHRLPQTRVPLPADEAAAKTTAGASQKAGVPRPRPAGRGEQ
ncbi:DUF2637 domain-containing protein [Streptomyces sp. NPDC015345]|uniref:DUF2637 domain-containing protein n=1 Tax=Streptomyces sp. NPDC015345 TaxID=3364953 RepID=UPI0036F57529